MGEHAKILDEFVKSSTMWRAIRREISKLLKPELIVELDEIGPNSQGLVTSLRNRQSRARILKAKSQNVLIPWYECDIVGANALWAISVVELNKLEKDEASKKRGRPKKVEKRSVEIEKESFVKERLDKDSLGKERLEQRRVENKRLQMVQSMVSQVADDVDVRTQNVATPTTYYIYLFI